MWHVSLKHLSTPPRHANAMFNILCSVWYMRNMSYINLTKHFSIFFFIPNRNKENISKAKQKYKKKLQNKFFFSFCSIMIGMKFFRGYYFTWEFYPQMKWKAKTILKNYFHIKNVILFTDDFVKLLWNLPFITLTASLLTVLKSSSHLTFFQYCLQYCQKSFIDSKLFTAFISLYCKILHKHV